MIEYNAGSRQTFWYDYHRRLESFHQVDRNGSFLPVVYFREKIAVHVCGLHFADQLTVTTNPLGLPEGGADIRGGTSTSTIPTLASVVDGLQSIAPTGTQAIEGGLGFGKAAELGTAPTITGITRGEDKSGYSDASISYSGKQIARMMYGTIRSGIALVDTLQKFQNGMPPEHAETLPGTPSNLVRQAMNLRRKIKDHSEDNTDAAAFDEDLSSVQSLVAQLNTLSGALTSQAFGTRAATLQDNFNTLTGIRDLIGDGTTTTPDGKPVVNQAFKKFTEDYHCELEALVQDSNASKQRNVQSVGQLEQWNPGIMFDALKGFKQQLEVLDQTTGDIFNLMNSWNLKSELEQTDVLTAATGNMLMRVAIIVQRGYTPFTLTANPSPTPTVAPASISSATTSTPPHAVKTILVEVHRRANFNVAGGVMLVHVPSTTFTVGPALNATVLTPATSSVSATYQASCNSGAQTPINSATYSCIESTQTSPWQISGMTGLVWYPFGHDYFPKGTGLVSYPRNYLPSLLLGTSITSFGSAVGAVNFEPVTGINLFVGVGSAHSNSLPTGVSTSSVLAPAASLSPAIRLKYGFTTGIAFDLGIFGQIFKTIPAAGLP